MFALPSAESRQLWAARADRLSRPLGLLFSLALLVVVIGQLRHADWSLLARSARLPVGFWLALATYYMISPLTELAIYSRLLGLGWSAFPALLRKLVSNELLLDYLGDVQFLAWVQANRATTGSPFAAVKDVTILSALTGNLVTLALIVLAWPYGLEGLPGGYLRILLVSLGVVIGVSTLILVLGKHLFSHPARTLVAVALLLAGRTIGAMLLSAVMWHLLMPGTALTALLMLATLRMIVSRLPLVPSKDLLFAGLAVVTFGRAADISGAAALIASLVLMMQLTAGLILAVAHLASARRGKAGAGERTAAPASSPATGSGTTPD